MTGEKLKKQKCLVLLSGGQDSTTCLFWAKRNFGKAEAVSFDYGQRHKRELKCAEKIARLAGVKHTVIKMREYEAIKESALLDIKKSASKKHRLNSGLPSTFVPGRNILFLSSAAALAYVKRIHNIVIGVSQADYSGYPDCRADFIKAMEKAVSRGMEYQFRIHAPLINKSKKETVKLAVTLGVLDMLSHTHTCYKGAARPCGECPACVLREKGFKGAGVKDPIYANSGMG